MDTLPNIGHTFDEKYELYSRLLFRLAMLYLGNYADAEDALQEVFIKLCYCAPPFEDREHEKRWLIRVTANICKDKLKCFWHKQVTELDNSLPYESTPENHDLSDIVFHLPPNCGCVIFLHYYEDYSVKEIASILHISTSAVKMRLKHGRDLLKMEMEG